MLNLLTSECTCAGSLYFSATSVCRKPPTGSIHTQVAHSCPPVPTRPSVPTYFTYLTWPSCPCPPSCPIRPSVRPSVISVSTTPTPTPNPSSVILPCSRHWTTLERVRKLRKGYCIASLGFGRIVILIDVVLVARHEGGQCGSGAKYVSFKEGFEFVIEEATEDLQDEQALVFDLEIPIGTIATRTPLHC